MEDDDIVYVKLPLYRDADYEYTVSLERVSYKLRFYYNERMEQWIADLRYANNDPIVLGEAVSPEYPLFVDYRLELTGFFWLEPIGKSKNETISNPLEIDKYYNLFYFYEDTE